MKPGDLYLGVVDFFAIVPPARSRSVTWTTSAVVATRRRCCRPNRPLDSAGGLAYYYAIAASMGTSLSEAARGESSSSRGAESD